MKRAVYDKQFKMAAVKLRQSEEKSVLDTAKGLGISPSSLRRWINEYDEYEKGAFPGHGNAPFNTSSLSAIFLPDIQYRKGTVYFSHG